MPRGQHFLAAGASPHPPDLRSPPATAGSAGHVLPALHWSFVRQRAVQPDRLHMHLNVKCTTLVHPTVRRRFHRAFFPGCFLLVPCQLRPRLRSATDFGADWVGVLGTISHNLLHATTLRAVRELKAPLPSKAIFPPPFSTP